jgi:hypothetical protein
MRLAENEFDGAGGGGGGVYVCLEPDVLHVTILHHHAHQTYKGKAEKPVSSSFSCPSTSGIRLLHDLQ